MSTPEEERRQQPEAAQSSIDQGVSAEAGLIFPGKQSLTAEGRASAEYTQNTEAADSNKEAQQSENAPNQMMQMMMAMMDKAAAAATAATTQAAAAAEATAAAQMKMNRDMFLEFAKMMGPQQTQQESRAHQPREAKLYENKLTLKDFTRIEIFEGGEERYSV